jgi:hypothetical protein
MEKLSLICIFLAAVLHVLHGVPRRLCNFVLQALQLVLTISLGESHPFGEWYGRTVVNQIPKDIRTVLERIGIDPVLKPFVCCTKCSCLYPLDDDPDEDTNVNDSDSFPYPEYCTSRVAPKEDLCNGRLRKMQIIQGRMIIRPIRVFYYQDFPSWLAALITRPGIEELLDKGPQRVSRPPPKTLEDIWDGSKIRSFTDKDGKLFFDYDYSSSEIRLLFSLSYDGFNPFTNKLAGKKASVGAIFMVCLNLPRHLRYELENMFLVGIVPGPKAPSLTQINHYLRPLITHLDIFWNYGFYFNTTPKFPNGRLARGVVIPLIADLHAIRQVAGFGSYNSTSFCTFCGLFVQDIEETDSSNWPPSRSFGDHLRHASEWLAAETLQTQEDLFNVHGVRWSELLRLGYWDPTSFTLYDVMHGWYLNVADNYVREILQVDSRNPSGDGQFVGKRPKGSPPTGSELLECLNQVKKSDKVTPPHNLSLSTLYYLCENRGLRRAGTRLQLWRTLQKFYVSHFHEYYGYMTKLTLGITSTSFRRRLAKNENETEKRHTSQQEGPENTSQK